MNERADTGSKTGADKGPDYSASLYLPQTEFPMRGGLPKKEPEILARWNEIDLYRLLREKAAGLPKFVLHDGPPYANGNIHIGHSLNKILKDLVTRSQQMLGKDSNYVPGWDCHGLPIEWKIEEKYRAANRNKDDVPIVEFRQECRAFAAHWLDVQREEFKRLGITGDWAHPYSTMSFAAEAQIAREIMKFAANGLLYRGSKPVMWSVVEKTALAEAEVEYEDYTSDTVFVAFPVAKSNTSTKSIRAATKIGVDSAGMTTFDDTAVFAEADQIAARLDAIDKLILAGTRIVIWTTTPWTMPGNRAISFSSKIPYGLYRVTAAPDGNWVKSGETYILADKLAADVFKSAKVETFERVADVDAQTLREIVCAHPLASFNDGYSFDVPLLDGDHVTDDAGTGFVHTAPGHGREDFDIWMANGRQLSERGINTRIPEMVDADGRYTDAAPGFTGHRVMDENGKKGDANDVVIKALVEAGNLVARGRLKHQYPHSWRSKKPVIYRNTPQWFIAMDKRIANNPHPEEARSAVSKDEGAASSFETRASHAPQDEGTRSLRTIALDEIAKTQWEPASGENRIRGMIANRPDWVVSRQRAWGVPIAVFVKKGEHIPLVDERVNARIADAFAAEGADAWFAPDAKARFLANDYSADDFDKIDDVLDVWFDSGSTHAFVLDDPKEFPGLSGIRRKRVGGPDEVMYLEGSDQHRGWFHSSLLESCGTRGYAPFDIVLTHGFTLDEQGRKMSKSLGNTTEPQKIIADAGADILRLWVASVDYSDDQRIGPEILKSVTDNYRKLRNTIRWMLGTLAHFEPGDAVDLKAAPELERLMLHRVAEIDAQVRTAYAEFDYKRVVALVTPFMTGDCSAFYFDIRKDALYCDAPSSLVRKAALTVVDSICDHVLKWLAPILVFTCEEAWTLYRPNGAASVHLTTFADAHGGIIDEALAAKWADIRRIRSVVTGALEIERANKRLGSSLEAAPSVFIEDAGLLAILNGIDLAEVCITSGIEIVTGPGPANAFHLPDVPGVAVVPARAEGRKCARSWKISTLVGSDAEFPDVTPRDAAALRELRAAGKWS